MLEASPRAPGRDAESHRPRSADGGCDLRVPSRVPAGRSLEHYIKRLGALEDIATAKPGVAKAYALQAGREIRRHGRADRGRRRRGGAPPHEIAREIEDQLEYPGQVKVIVIRESRAIEVAK